MAQGNFHRETRTAHCTICQEDFETTSTNAIVCKKLECQKEKAKRYQQKDHVRRKRIREYNKDVPTIRKRKPCIRGCGNTTLNYFGICNTCRGNILESIDVDFLQCMS